MFTLLLIIICLAFISLGLPDSLFGASWPIISKSISAPINYVGYLSVIAGSGTVISSFLSGKILKKFSTFSIVFVSVLLTATALLGISYSNSFVELCLWALPLGIGAGAVDSSLNNFVALHYKAKHMNWLHSFWGIGASTGPLIMSFYLLNNQSWNNGYFTIAILQFSLVAILLFSKPLWKKLENKNTQEQEENAEIAVDTSYKVLFNLMGLKPMLVVFFCYICIESITGIWVASYLVESRGVVPAVATQWVVLFFGGITGGRFLSGFLSSKFSNNQLVTIGHSIIALGIVSIIIPTKITLVLGVSLIGLGCAPIFPSLLHETPNNFGKKYSQAVMGLQMSSAYVATIVIPPLFGKLAQVTDFSIFPFVIGLILIVKVVLFKMVKSKKV